MASISLLFFATLYASSLFLHPMHAVIPIGATLTPTTKPASWASPSGLFAFGYYKQGDGFALGIWLETIPNKTVVWTANRDGPPVPSSTKLLLTDGGLLLKTPGTQDKTISGYLSSSTASASLLNSGNFVLYDFDSNIIWQTFDSPTDTILGGQNLYTGNQLYSSISDTNHSIGQFRLSMQSDGNLVMYPVGSDDSGDNSYWSTNTFGIFTISSLYLNVNGSISLISSTNSSIRGLLSAPSSSNRETRVYCAKLDPDGIFRRYSHNLERNSSSTESTDVTEFSNKCEVKGTCGVNSYCTQMGGQTDCVCLPGYKLKDPNQHHMGCLRNFSDEDCGGKNNRLAYSISLLKNTSWQDSSYDILSSSGEEDCKDKCLGDCNCDAAIFGDAKCKKMKIPLNYGMAVTSTSATTLIKVGMESVMTINETLLHNMTNFTEIKRSKPHKEIWMVSVTVATCLIFVFAITFFVIYRHQIQHYRRMSEERNLGLSEEIVLRSFSYNELQRATKNFTEELGKGSFGRVYKGAISSGTKTIAAKRLEKVVEEGEREFRAEMRAIGRTHHRNLVRLIGFCDEGSYRLLVYEYMSNGSLANLLFKAERWPSWNERVRIALDVARGIRYLHEDCEPHIIHCDIKPENILMDDSWTAKISDFGLAKLLMPNQTRTFTGIRGTRGYLAPEWHKNTPITVKTDVYSYGIVLFEIICCRRNIELEVPDNEIILHEWVYDCFEGRKLGELLKEEEVDVRILERMVKVGLWCIQNEPPLRPSMKNVILMLEGNMDIPMPPSPTSSTMS